MGNSKMEYFEAVVSALIAYRQSIGRDATFDEFADHLKENFKREIREATGDSEQGEVAAGLCAGIGFWEFED